ncbi:response regulator [Phormidium sp. FACHB-1136]|uniref:response regulator n=1 Tax=Phormidium sp. FACHB-1136 TaxID=2692848 RepID=UPI001688F29F|nr:response regulator [Phormidium sp. FACHB-1136]MBD2428177.1 response regulator [Phormidium sp. FACHB-1136]
MQDDPLDRLIVLIDHHADHVEAVRQVLADKPDQHHLRVIEDGSVALDWLRSIEGSEPGQRPDLILLDLDLPHQASLDILTALKGNPNLRRIPVIVLSESNQTDDVFQTYFNQGNCYVVKNANPQQLVATIQNIESFWLGIVTLPD